MSDRIKWNLASFCTFQLSDEEKESNLFTISEQNQCVDHMRKTKKNWDDFLLGLSYFFPSISLSLPCSHFSFVLSNLFRLNIISRITINTTLSPPKLILINVKVRSSTFCVCCWCCVFFLLLLNFFSILVHWGCVVLMMLFFCFVW